MGTWWEAKDRSVLACASALPPLPQASCSIYTKTKGLLKDFRQLRKCIKLYLCNFLGVCLTALVLVKFIHTRQFFKLKGTNPYEINLTAHLIFCQPFVLLESTFPYILWSVFFFYQEKIEGELEESGQEEKDSRKKVRDQI